MITKLKTALSEVVFEMVQQISGLRINARIRIFAASVWFLLLFFGANDGCFGKDSDKLKFLVTRDAYDLKTVTLGSSFVTQISYRSKISYPLLAIGDTQVKQLEKDGWFQCAKSNREWEHFLDATVPKHRYVFQVEKSFLKKDQFVTVFMRYVSSVETAKMPAPVPSSDVQNVVILIYDLRDSSVRQEMEGVVSACR